MLLIRRRKIADAIKLCPHVRVVHVATYKEGENEPVYVDEPDSMTHKVRGGLGMMFSSLPQHPQVSLDHYRRESMKIISIFKEDLTSAEIGEYPMLLAYLPDTHQRHIAEKASIDEAFIDLTAPVREEIIRRYPNFAEVPENGTLDTPLPDPPAAVWDDLGALVPIVPEPEESEFKPETETASEDKGKRKDAVFNIPDVPSWHDVALSIGASLMKPTRERIHRELGYTTSAVGVLMFLPAE